MIINKDNFLHIIEDISGTFASARNTEQLLEGINENFKKIIESPDVTISVIFDCTFELSPNDGSNLKIYFSPDDTDFARKTEFLKRKNIPFYFTEDETGNHYYFGLNANQEFLGIIYISAPRFFFFSDEDKQLLTILSNLFSISLEKVLSLKRMEENQEKHRQIIEQSADIIYTCDFKGNFTYVNPVSIKVTGYSEAEIIGMPFLSFIRPDYKAKAAEFYQMQFARKIHSTYFEFPIKTKTDEEVWLGQNVQGLYDGKFTKGFQAVARDITRQRKAEKAVFKSELKFRTLSSNAPVGIFHTDTNGYCLYVNEKWSAITGRSLEEGLGNNWQDALHPEDKEFALEEWGKFINHLVGELSLDFRYITKENATIWVTVKAAPLPDENGNIKGYIGTITDISERKRSEAALKETTDKMVGIFNNSYDAIFLADPITHQILDCNPRAAELFDLNDKGELIGIFGEDMHTHELTEAQKREIEYALRNKQPWTGEFKYITCKGRSFWASFTLKMIEINGKLMELVRLTDISEKKRMEEELIQAKIETETSLKVKEQFLSVISHEIRTPMNAILGMTNLLLQEHLAGSHRELLDGIKYSADNLLVIINDILDYSKIGAGKIEFEEIDFAVKDIFKGILTSMAYKAEEKNIRLEIHVDTQMPSMLKGDPFRLNQILINLTSNALKFTETGSILVSARAVEARGDETLIEFSVKDTGIGIPEDKLEVIFESFTQASSATTRKYGGSGLGLAIVKKLVELQQGFIEVESAPGKGSTFTFTLPFKQGNEEVKKQNENEDLFSFTGTRILIAEDNLMNQHVTTLFLNNWNIETEIANDGVEALKKIGEKQFDLIFMDLQMPNMDGYDASKAIRQIKGCEHLPIIALTASVLLDVKKQIRDAGMDDYVAKPFNPKELNFKIASYLPHKIKR